MRGGAKALDWFNDSFWKALSQRLKRSSRCLQRHSRRRSKSYGRVRGLPAASNWLQRSVTAWPTDFRDSNLQVIKFPGGVGLQEASVLRSNVLNGYLLPGRKLPFPNERKIMLEFWDQNDQPTIKKVLLVAGCWATRTPESELMTIQQRGTQGLSGR